MTESRCPSPRSPLFLNAAYHHRDDRPATKGDIEAFITAELDFVHRLITRHRMSCPLCRFNESVLSLGPRTGPSVIPIDRAQVH